MKEIIKCENCGYSTYEYSDFGRASVAVGDDRGYFKDDYDNECPHYGSFELIMLIKEDLYD